MAGFGLGIRYLNGWAMAAADGAKKEVAEWPPHPDRVFMALAAAWFETDQNASEGAALRWLESLPPPALAASDADRRLASKSDRPTVTYVPVNDTERGRGIPAIAGLGKLKDAGLALLPEYRSRQPRGFPLAVPHQDQVFLIWQEPELGEYRDALASLTNKVTHIGDSASFTQMWVTDSPPIPNWVPTNGVAQHRLRAFGLGRLDALEAGANHNALREYADLSSKIGVTKGKVKRMLQEEMAHRFGDRKPVSRRPEPSFWKGYTTLTKSPPFSILHSIFDSRMTALTLSGRPLPVSATLRLTEALRGAIQKFCPQPIPEWVSGHAPDGSASKQSHFALAPLAFVGAEHADGRLLGVAIVLPRGLDPSDATRCLEPLLYEDTGLPRMIKLYESQWLECRATLEQRESPPYNLRTETWTRPSRLWASVTPVVLDRHFDGSDKWEKAAESVKEACGRIGLPWPREVLLHPVSLVEGVPHARDFPYLTRKSDGGRMHHSHAVLVFDDPVEGPILLGAGRYRGYGFFRPLRGGS